MPTLCVDALLDYIETCPGKRDILTFLTPERAGEVAHQLRSQTDEAVVHITASYNKVYVKVKNEQTYL